MKRLYIYGLLLLLVIGAGSCNREHFDNEDNYIQNLKFVVGDKIFNGEIEGDEIFLNLPENINLKEVKVEYSLSEKAAIEPLPQELKEWKESNAFTVYSQNQQVRHYTIVIKRIPVSAKTDVVLNNDEEVAAFAQKGINQIDGDLIIGNSSGKDKITSLKGLETIKEVNYRLIIGKGYTGSDLKGLENLQKVGSILIEKGADDAEPLSVDLPNLTRCYNDITFERERISTIDFEKLETLKNLTVHSCVEKNMNFNSLKYAQSIRFENHGNNELYAELIDFPQLIKTDEPLRISNINQIKKLSFEKLTEIPGININGMQGLETIYAPQLNKIKELSLSYVKGLKRLEMPQLTEATLIKIISTEKLENLGEFLSQFKKLEKFESYELKVKEPINIDLSKCKNLVSAEFYETYIKEIKVPEETELLIYPAEEQIEIPIFHNPIIKSLSLKGFRKLQKIELNGIKEVRQILRIEDSSATTINLDEVSKLTKLLISSCDKVQKIVANNITEAKEIIITGKALREIQMDKLENTDILQLYPCKYLSIYKFPALTTINKTLQIGGSYSGYQNSEVSNLNGFDMLKSAKEISIQYCSSLSDFSGLKKLFESNGITKEGWKVGNNLFNPSFEDMKNGKYKKEDSE